MSDVITKTEIKVELPEPFLGRLILEAIIEDVTAYKKELYGLSADSKIQLLETDNDRVPYKKGKIIKMAPDTFGERFRKYYGSDHKFPELGDTVLFVPNQQMKIDPSGKYWVINDEHIVGFYKGDKR